MHVVLGASGAVGQGVIRALQAKQVTVKAVERSKSVEGIETIFADLCNEKQTIEAVAGASHVYLCVGLPYRTEMWQSQWPKLMQSVIAACVKNDAKLTFFDNIYMYGPPPLATPFDENHLQNPTTHKGIVRKQIADLLLNAHNSGKLKAVIGRSADFYGPKAINSPFYIKFLERINQGKNPQWLGKPGQKHTYANTLDNGRALVRLALDDSTYGQVWHLPVDEPVTIDEILRLINHQLGVSYKVSYLPRPLLGLISLIVPPVKEAREMLYQFDEPYIMSDKKFKNKYPDFQTTSYEVGLEDMVKSYF
jgi:nucleoside-diphosphate-sugar epimerase